ncbi:MAG: transcriptional repressor [Deltaproteobacteria bacterium]|nr:transcriptional repressor [Deltaproteobacteria bacterium]
MFESNQFEKTNFRTLIETDGSDRIQERMDILDAFLSTEEHITLEEMFRLLETRGLKIEPEFLKQCMNRMVDLGFAQKKQFKGQPIRYEHRHLGNHHDHLICTKCGKIKEFNDEAIERLQLQVAALHGFHMLQHQMDIYGLCTECTAKRKPLIPLTLAKTGETIIIREIGGGRAKRARLTGMGLRINDVVEIINNSGMGRLILGHNGMRLAIGRGAAQHIMVSLTDDSPDT